MPCALVGKTQEGGDMRPTVLLCLIALVAGTHTLHAQRPSPADAPTTAIRPGMGAGLGVAAINATDVVNIVNSTPGALEQVSSFKAAAEFFGYVSVPLDPSWLIKADYGYVLASYNIAGQYGTAEYTLSAHLPSVVVQYVLHDAGLYCLKAGLGGGYHWGSLREKFSTLDKEYKASGAGIVIEMEGNTALGESLYMYLGVQAQWELMGSLQDAGGQNPAVNIEDPTLHWFGAGARLGFAYLF
jgi:hypothetical protein